MTRNVSRPCGTSFPLPTPYTDELLYSVIARSAYRTAQWSPKGLIADIFGEPSVLACPDLPSRLALLNSTGWGMSVSELALRYTLVGYYTHFLGATERSRILGLMAGKSGYLHLRLGVCASVVVAPRTFRLCPVCTEMDARRTGETYWRRTHQLPGVLVCPDHAVPLVATNIPLRPIGRYEHVYARAQFLAESVPVVAVCGEQLRELLDLANAAARLLEAEVRVNGPLHDYRESLYRRGFHGLDGLANLWRTLLALYGRQSLCTLIRCGEDAHPPAWLSEVVRRPRRPLHPLKHLLLERIFRAHQEREADVEEESQKTWGVYKAAALRDSAQSLALSGFTVYGVAKKLGVDWKTAHRLLKPLPLEKPKNDSPFINADRTAWLSLVEQSPDVGRTQWRQMEPALYARMYRRDREWLMQHGSRFPKKPTLLRVDWGSRDEKLAVSVQRHAKEIKQQEPIRRASQSYVLGTLGARTLVGRYGSKLPLTHAALLTSCEPVEDFQVRRLVARGARGSLQVMPFSSLMRAVGLNPDRFSDRGVAIVTRARRLFETRRPWGR